MRLHDVSVKPFEQVVDEHGPAVLRACRAILSPADADDAWSETFLAALRAYPQLRPGSNVRAWLVTIAAFPTAAAAFAPALTRSVRAHPGLKLLLRQSQHGEGLRQVRTGEVDVALVDDWSGRLAGGGDGALRFYLLIHDPLVLVVPRRHPAADPAVPVDLRWLRDEAWLAGPAGEPSRQAVDRLLAGVGGAAPVPWEFEGLGTILNLVARGIGIAALPRLALAAGEGRVAVRELPGAGLDRDVYAVARASSVNRPSVAAILSAVHSAASHLSARHPADGQPRPPDGRLRPPDGRLRPAAG